MPQEDAKLIGEIVDAGRSGRRLALVTVIAARKSTPRKAGAKMIVREDGSGSGTIGGGVLEARAMREAHAALAQRRPRKVSYSLDPDGKSSLPMCCGGAVELFIDVL